MGMSSVTSVLRRAGALRAARFWRRNRLTILTVHGVMGEHPCQTWRPFRSFLEPRQLEQYIRVLQRDYQFVSLSEAVDMLCGRETKRARCLVLTFDDGYRNNATAAWPILQQCGVPATFFLVSGLVENPEPFWFDRLDYAFQQLPVDRTSLSLAIGDRVDELDVQGRQGRFNSCRAVRELCKLRSPEEIQSVVEQVENAANGSLVDTFAGDEWTALMGVEDIQRMSGEGADFGSHTVNHVILDKASDETARYEFAESKQAIENWTGRACEHVCYPSGRTNSRTPIVAREAGYVCGLTTVEGANKPGDNLHLLRRINLPPGISDAELQARVCGVAQTLHRWRRRVYH